MRFRIRYQELFTAPVYYRDISAPSFNHAKALAFCMEAYVLSVKQIIRVPQC